MVERYSVNYLEAFAKVLKESMFERESKQISQEEWLVQVVSLSNSLEKNNGRIFFVGNGASAAFSNHMALDWSKNGGVQSVSLSDSAMLTALANDYSYEESFVEYMKICKCSSSDILVSVSSSGNSPNIRSAIDYAKSESIPVVGLSGLKVDNYTRKTADFSLYVSAKTYGIVECAHQLFLHMWLDRKMEIHEWDRTTVQNMNNSEFNL